MQSFPHKIQQRTDRKAVYNYCERRKNKAGQNDRQSEKGTGQQAYLAGHCPLTGRYFEPCSHLRVPTSPLYPLSYRDNWD